MPLIAADGAGAKRETLQRRKYSSANCNQKAARRQQLQIGFATIQVSQARQTIPSAFFPGREQTGLSASL
jgi:hypothetical protein